METDKCCLYCNEPLNMSNEHILQEGFGATLSSTEIICRNCNDLFSSTIDIICVEQNALLCNQAGISGKPKKRRKKEGGKKVIVYNSKNRKFEIDGKQKIKELKKTQVNEITDENGKLTGLSINGYDYKAVKAIEQSLRKKYPLNDAIIKNEILPLDKYKFKSAYGNSYFKGIKKSIINFLAYMEPNIARSSFLKDARHDIYNSSKNIELSIDNPAPAEPVFPLYAIDEKFIPVDIIPSNNTDFFHSIIVSINPKDKSIIGVAILFSKIIHAFKLSTNYEGDVASTYIYNCMPLGIGSNRTKILEKNGPIFKISDMKSSTDPQYINKNIKTNFNKLFDDLSSKARSTYFVNRMQRFFDMHPVPKGKVCEHINEIETAFFYILQDFAYAIHQDAVISYAPITDLIKFASARLAHEIPIHLQNKKVSLLQIQFGLIAFEYFHCCPKTEFR